MKARQALLIIPFIVGALACSAVQAQTSSPATQFTVGAKIWHAAWQSYLPTGYTGITPDGTPALANSVNEVEGKTRTDVLPQLAVRHGDYFASMNYGRFKTDFNAQRTSVTLPTGQNLITSRSDHFKRREADLNLGYFVTPEVAVALIYKDATEDRATSLGIAPQSVPTVRTRARGVLLGVSGSFAVIDKLRLYVQGGYGPARLRFHFPDPALGTAKTDGSYIIGEIGLSYPLVTGTAGGVGVTAALGYRTQTVKTDSYGDPFQINRDLRDVREGAVLSLNFTL